MNNFLRWHCYLFSIFTFSTGSGFAWETPPSQACAQIFFAAEYQGPSVVLRDQEQLSDLTAVWNQLYQQPSQRTPQEDGSEILSYRVQQGCILKTANSTFMRGENLEFDMDVNAVASFPPLSASCQCQQTCDCQNIRLRRAECARAYLNDDCTNCKAPFTSMESSNAWTTFPEKWSSNVKSLVIKEGCELSVRSLEQNQDYTLSTRVVHEVEQFGSISHYHCRCDESSFQSNRQNLQELHSNENYPRMLNIPKTKGEINTMFFSKDLQTHPGLRAAFQSLRSKRNSANAYILLLGMSGSGKSSAVNLLFDHPNITKVGDAVSTTQDILEFSIPVPVPELGMNNSALHVIDTPGIGDTGGLEADARFLASLEDFLNKHLYLRRAKPNLVLIFSKFSDNRYQGDGAPFVKMLRTIDMFRDKIIDTRFTNVIFVLTHYMSETKSVTRDPHNKINSIRKVVQEYSTLPRPIHIVLAENKPEASHLHSVNGYYQLPNGEFYPKNLFDQMQRSLVACGDPVGEAIIRNAFSKSDSFQISSKRHRLLHRSNAKVTKYLGQLIAFDIPVSGTEISTHLNEAYMQLDPELKARYPDALNILQRSLYLQRIHNMGNLPRSSADTIKLFENLHLNPVTLFLLETALNLTVPEFKEELVVGSGYSLISDKVLPARVFQPGDGGLNQQSDILYRLPDAYVVQVENQVDPQFQVFTSQDDLMRGRMTTLGLSEDAAPIGSYNEDFWPPSGFNLVSLVDDDNSTIVWNSLSATVDYHTFRIALSNKAQLSHDFISRVQHLQSLNLTDPANVNSWRDFFSRYGTHVVVMALGGGTITVKVEMLPEHASQPNSKKWAILSQTMGNIVTELGNDLMGKSSIYNAPDGVSYTLSQKGGSHKHHWSNFSQEDSTRNVNSWKDSLRYEPVVLTNRLQLMPISEVVNQVGQNPEVALMIQEAANSLLNSSLLFVPVTGIQEDDPESRDNLATDPGYRPQGDLDSMLEFSDMFKTVVENNQKMQQDLIRLMEESKLQQQIQQQRWDYEMALLTAQGEEKEKLKMEQERFEMQLKMQMEEADKNRKLQENMHKYQIDGTVRLAKVQNEIGLADVDSRLELGKKQINLADLDRQRLKDDSYQNSILTNKQLDLEGQRISLAQQTHGREMQVRLTELEANKRLQENALMAQITEARRQMILQESLARAELEARNQHVSLDFIQRENQRRSDFIINRERNIVQGVTAAAGIAAGAAGMMMMG